MNCTRFKRLKRVVFPAFILFSLFASVCSYAQNEEIPLYLESGEDFLIYDDSTSSLIDSPTQRRQRLTTICKLRQMKHTVSL
jgi:hypothetical protein